MAAKVTVPVQPEAAAVDLVAVTAAVRAVRNTRGGACVRDEAFYALGEQSGQSTHEFLQVTSGY
jgi:hypothetical protein